MQTQHREQLEQYIRAVSVYRGFRLKYDSATSTVLDQLEQTEVDRAQMLHRVLKLYLEIQQVMVQQSLRNIDTISKHIANIDAHSDNMVFVEKYRSNQKRPPLPDPKFHPDGIRLCDYMIYTLCLTVLSVIRTNEMLQILAPNHYDNR